MMASKLPVDALGKIWNLSDIDRDGQLDGDEFTVVSGSLSMSRRVCSGEWQSEHV